MKQDYLLTYNPNNFEAHPDSSDFESCVLPLPHIKNKPGYHRLVKSSFGSKTKNIYYNKAECDYIKNDYDLESPLKECEANSSLLCQMRNKCYGQSNRGHSAEKRPSRLCVLRQKVLPRFSTIFRQTASSKPVAKHRERKQGHTSCQQCQTCLRKRIKKPYSRRENSIIQPVYALEAGMHLPKVFIPNDGPKNTYSFTSTSDSGNPEKLRRKNSKFKKKFRTEMMREHWNYQHSLKQKYQKHPNTPTDHKPVQQVYNSSTRCHLSRLASSISDYSYMAEMPSSGFWDFLFDKIHTKYQIHKCEVKPCACARPGMFNGQQCCCDPRTPCFYRTSKCNQFPSQPHIPQQCSPMSRSIASIQKPIVKCECKPPSTKKPKSQGTAPKSPDRSPKGSPKGSPRRSQQDNPQCCSSSQGSPKHSPKCAPECPPKSPPRSPSRSPPKSPAKNPPKSPPKSPPKCAPACEPMLPVGGDSNPCQEDHDQIKNMLSKKYNGEILCIHNPPCILINGCLNLPAAEVEQPSNSFWPVLFKNIPIKKHSRKVKREKSCQYAQSCEVQHARLPEIKQEEKIHSLCSHVPPCDLIRCCDQKNCDSILDNSCNHVPMCTMRADSATNRADSATNRSPWGSLKNYVCDHLPKCQELPIDSKSYDLMNGTESFGVQAQQDTSGACRHNPPCIMVPKCMGGISVLNNYIQYDAIPDCSHSPVCETIPACCRNNHKEMVSVSSQYPHSCRIV